MHYTGTIWRPPYEAYSLLLQVTAGCTHHSCKFCTLYDDLPFPFRMSPLAEVEADLQEASRFPQNGERVFFTGANPFALKTDKLEALARMVKTYFPENRTIGCFARITDITPKSSTDLQALQALGYDGLTIGVETCDNDALAFMHKGYTAADVLEQCQKLDAAGIRYNFFYLTGISGAGRGASGARETARVFNQLHPQIIGSSMLTVQENSALYREIAAGNWQEETEIEKLAELQTLIESLSIHTQIATDGASNLIRVYGRLPEDREKLLRQLTYHIAHASEAALREYRVNLRHL